MKITDKAQIAQMEPKAPMHWMVELTKIPRPSYHEEKVLAFLVRFAEDRGLRYHTDDSRNVIIYKDATTGYEKAAPILLQGHTDMVCEKNADVQIDFENDPLSIYVENGEMHAEGTTLGGDDGAAVAAMLALLDAKDIPHPKLECLFTASEEVGLDGANGVDMNLIEAKRMINLDSESLDEIISGCSGGVRTDLHFETNPQDVQSDETAVQVALRNLCGGHSGENINAGRANANKCLGRLLLSLKETVPFTLASLEGGSKDNAIPRDAVAVIVLKKTDVEKAKEILNEEARKIQSEWISEDAQASWTISDTEVQTKWNADVSNKVITCINAAQNGVLSMHRDIKGLVGFSRNMGVIRSDKDSVDIVFSTRSELDAQLDASCRELASLGQLCGGTARSYARYPGWAHAKESALRDLWSQTYTEQTGKTIRNVVIHAGLECGILSQKKTGLDIISVGPDMADIHSPKETLFLESFASFWTILKAVLKAMND